MSCTAFSGGVWWLKKIQTTFFYDWELVSQLLSGWVDGGCYPLRLLIEGIRCRTAVPDFVPPCACVRGGW